MMSQTCETLQMQGSFQLTDVFHFSIFMGWLGIFYCLFYFVYHRMADRFMNPYCDPNAKSYLVEMPLRIVRLFHAILCSILFIGISFGIFGHYTLFLSRIMNTSNFLFDGLLVHRLWLKYLEAPTLMKKMQLGCTEEAGQNAMQKDKIKIQNPNYNWFHHILTTLAFYGVSQDNRTIVLMAYMGGEIAIVFSNITWFCHKCEWLKDRVSASRKRSLQVWTCALYALLRCINFFLMGVFFIIPGLMWCNVGQCIFSMVMMCIFAAIWAMNCLWLWELCQMTFNVKTSDVTRAIAALKKKHTSS